MTSRWAEGGVQFSPAQIQLENFSFTLSSSARGFVKNVGILTGELFSPASHVRIKERTMHKRTCCFICLLILSLALTTVASLHGQMATKSKPAVYTYVAEWSVP